MMAVAAAPAAPAASALADMLGFPVSLSGGARIIPRKLVLNVVYKLPWMDYPNEKVLHWMRWMGDGERGTLTY